MKSIFDIIPPATIAVLIGVTRQRVHAMLRNMDSGDNRKRVNAALREVRGEIDNYLKSQAGEAENP